MRQKTKQLSDQFINLSSKDSGTLQLDPAARHPTSCTYSLDSHPQGDYGRAVVEHSQGDKLAIPQ